MPLSCACDDYGDYDWYFLGPDDYSTLDTKRRRRCLSCKDLISIGATVLKFYCYRSPNNDIEEAIYDSEVPLAPKFMCERCGDIYFSLEELGFCLTLDEPMLSLLSEYQSTYGPKEICK